MTMNRDDEPKLRASLARHAAHAPSGAGLDERILERLRATSSGVPGGGVRRWAIPAVAAAVVAMVVGTVVAIDQLGGGNAQPVVGPTGTPTSDATPTPTRAATPMPTPTVVDQPQFIPRVAGGVTFLVGDNTGRYSRIDAVTGHASAVEFPGGTLPQDPDGWSASMAATDAGIVVASDAGAWLIPKTGKAVSLDADAVFVTSGSTPGTVWLGHDRIDATNSTASTEVTLWDMASRSPLRGPYVLKDGFGIEQSSQDTSLVETRPADFCGYDGGPAEELQDVRVWHPASGKMSAPLNRRCTAASVVGPHGSTVVWSESAVLQSDDLADTTLHATDLRTGKSRTLAKICPSTGGELSPDGAWAYVYCGHDFAASAVTFVNATTGAAWVPDLKGARVVSGSTAWDPRTDHLYAVVTRGSSDGYWLMQLTPDSRSVVRAENPLPGVSRTDDVLHLPILAVFR